MPTPSCECGRCARCQNREHAARYRAKRRRDGISRVDHNGQSGLARMSLEDLRAASAQAIRDEEIRAYGPQAPGSTLDPARVFSLREVRDK